MTDIQDKETNEEVELTEEEKTALNWMNYVGREVNTLLGMFLPISKEGVVGVKYKHPVREILETGPEYDTGKAEGIEIRLVFNFEEVIDMPTEKKE